MLWYHLSLCTQCSCAGGASRHLFHSWRELRVLMWSGPSQEAVPSTRARSFFSNISAVEGSLGHEGEMPEAREGSSADSAAEVRPCHSVWHLLVPPHSVELSPSAICGPDPLIDFSAHREHGRTHNAQKAVGSLYLVLLLSSRELSIFDRPPEIGQDHQFSSILSQTAGLQR